jgi:xanthine dehydrogenase iron-sulfur cluster and FAD-binding subunit A
LCSLTSQINLLLWLFSASDETLLTEYMSDSKFKPYDSSQEPIFPPELKLKSDQFKAEALFFQRPDMSWFRPTTMKNLLTLKAKYPDAKLVVGNSELGVEMKFKHTVYPVMIQPTQIKDLTKIGKDSYKRLLFFFCHQRAMIVTLIAISSSEKQ